ncbi:MAG: site-specific integrase, partial [Prevotella pallens]|nr:site-specific integrase [Prevotella pallens]
MSKKNFVSQKQKATIEEIVAWKTPTFHQASECYVAVSAFDPTIGKLHTKKFM